MQAPEGLAFPERSRVPLQLAAIRRIAFVKRRREMLTIHGVPISVHTRKVIVAAIEKDVPYRNEPVIPFHPPAGWERLRPN